MARTYFAYADSADGSTNFSLTQDNRQYMGRFTDHDRDAVQSAINIPVVAGDERNLLLDTETERTSAITGNDVFTSYDSSVVIDSTQTYILSFDAILVDDLGSAEPKITPFYASSPELFGEGVPINLTWGRYKQVMPVGVNGYSSVAIHSNVGRDSESQCVFAIKNVKLELGDVATEWLPAYEDMLAGVDAKILEPSSYQWKVIRNSVNADWWSTQGVVRTWARLTLMDSSIVDVYDVDYIKSVQVTQNLSSGNDKPTFDFVSDRLEMTLYSLDNDFNPFAEDSQYYGKFILGTRIDLYAKVDYLGVGDELNWDKIGEFKVAEIDVSPLGTEAYILAYDFGYDGIENSKQQVLAPLRDIETSQDIEAFFDDVFPDYNIFIQAGINARPRKLFTLENKLATINEFMEALFCFSRCSGNNITIRTFDNILRGTLDKNNIVSASPEQSLVRQYNSSVVKWNEIGLQSGTEIISILADFATAGQKAYRNVSFGGYINKLEEIVCFSSDGADVVDANISNVYSNSLSLNVQSQTKGMVDVKVRAETISFNEVLEGPLDSSEDIYELNNKYIQTKNHAELVRSKVNKFVTTKNQYCHVELLFNPLLKLASLVKCEHSDYGINMNGYIVEQTFEVSDAAPAGRHSVVLLNREAVA